MSRRLEEDDRIVPLTRRTAPAPAPERSWRGWKTAALAAGLAGVVAFTGWFQTAGRVGTLERQLAEQPAVTAPAPVPSAAGGQVPSASSRNERLAAELQEKLKKVDQEEKELSTRLDQLAEARPAATTPQIISGIASLSPAADVVRGGEPAATQEILARQPTVVLLPAVHQETHRDHAVEILDASGKVAWSATGLTRNADSDGYVLSLAPGVLPAGTYTIHVYGIADGRREPVESYSIRVR